MNSLSININNYLKSLIKSKISNFVKKNVASKLFSQNYTIWPNNFIQDAKNRMGWTHTSSTSLPLLKQIKLLKNQFLKEKINNFILSGMGGSSLGASIITKYSKKKLNILDTTNSDGILKFLDKETIKKSCLILSSKSGSTIEVDIHRRIFENIFSNYNLDVAKRIVVITDKFSKLDKLAQKSKYRKIFYADSKVGGRYSSFTAFGLVPSGLVGVDINKILYFAKQMEHYLSIDSKDNIGIQLGSLLGYFDHKPYVKNIFIIDDGSGFCNWLTQLIAESTGKIGRGLIPIPIHIQYLNNDLLLKFVNSKSKSNNDYLIIYPKILSNDDKCKTFINSSFYKKYIDVTLEGNLYQQMILWEFSIVIASILMQVNPFDQPNVESSKKVTKSLLEKNNLLNIRNKSSCRDNLKTIIIDKSLNNEKIKNMAKLILNFLKKIRINNYLSIQVYSNRIIFKKLQKIQQEIAYIVNCPIIFEIGPQFLHSTGQMHKGGPNNGYYMQIIVDSVKDIDIPGMNFSSQQLMNAQASGDAKTLIDNKKSVLILQLQSNANNIKNLVKIIKNAKELYNDN